MLSGEPKGSILQGGVRFPTGGDGEAEAREAWKSATHPGPIRWDSEADRTVGM